MGSTGVSSDGDAPKRLQRRVALERLVKGTLSCVADLVLVKAACAQSRSARGSEKESQVSMYVESHKMRHTDWTEETKGQKTKHT